MWQDYFPDYYGGFGNASAPWNESTGTGSGGGVNSSDNSPFGPTIPNSGWSGSVANMMAPYNPTWPQYDPSNPSGPIYFPWPDPGGGGGMPFPPIFIEPFPTSYPNPPDPETTPGTGLPSTTPENPGSGSGEGYPVNDPGAASIDPETGRPTLRQPGYPSETGGRPAESLPSGSGTGPGVGGQLPSRGPDWKVPTAVGSAGAAIGAIIAGQGQPPGPVTQPQPPTQAPDPTVPPVVPPPTSEPGPVTYLPEPGTEQPPNRGGQTRPPGPVIAPRWPPEYKPPTAGPTPVLEEPTIPPPVLPPVTDPTLPGPPATEIPPIPKIPGLSGIVVGGSGAPLPGPFAPLVGAGPTQSVFQNNYQATPVASIGDLLSQFMQMYGGR